MRILFGFIGVVLSLLFIIYRPAIKHFFGEIKWAEARFGPGGTYTLMLFIGLAGFVISLMIMTGTLNFLLGGFINTLFSGVK